MCNFTRAWALIVEIALVVEIISKRESRLPLRERKGEGEEKRNRERKREAGPALSSYSPSLHSPKSTKVL